MSDTEEITTKKPTKRQKLWEKHEIPSGTTAGMMELLQRIVQKQDWREAGTRRASIVRLQRIGYIMPSRKVCVGSGWMWSPTLAGAAVLLRWGLYWNEWQESKKKKSNGKRNAESIPAA